ncbi:MAG: hypothetical protein Q7R35_18850 [Elusimicrobiota bacterium]|nr:hypothetical protein [Elusimicrobiota bacterium]
MEENNVGGSAGFFMEGNSLVRLGLSAGYGVMPVVFSQHRLTYASGYKNTELDTKTTYVPVDLYLKLGTEGGGASFFLGGGGDFVTSISEYRVNNTNGTDYQEKATFTQKKMIPHAQAGG